MATTVEARSHRGADVIEPTRMVNLSDAVFAIAMTLLVLGLEVPDVEASGLGPALRGMLPNLLAFALAFGLVSNVWWVHHRLFARLAHLDRGLVAINLVLLGVVALVPFPAGLLGSHPTARAAVLPFIATFAVLIALFLALNLRAQRVGAWREPMPPSLTSWVMASWALALGVVVAAGAIALVSPVAGLVVLVVSNLPETIIVRRAPAGYAAWS